MVENSDAELRVRDQREMTTLAKVKRQMDTNCRASQ